MNPRIKKMVGFLKWLPDKQYLRLYYFIKFKRHLNLKNPQTYNEKLQWLKLYNRRPEYTTIVDKYEVKKFISNIIGEQYIIPTLGVWDSVEDIDFDALPNQFVLKCTHDSGGLVVCKDKSSLDISETKNILNKALKTSFYYIGREWPYKNVKPRIIAEKYMEDTLTGELRDYKFFCFDGVVKSFRVDTERGTGNVKMDYFDRNGKHMPFERGHKNADVMPKVPQNINEMMDIAEKLSKGFCHLRVDLYNANGEIYFGELTFFSANGMVPFNPKEWDYKFGEWITLPKKSRKGI